MSVDACHDCSKPLGEDGECLVMATELEAEVDEADRIADRVASNQDVGFVAAHVPACYPSIDNH
jgi:hypothetical protein